MCFMNDGLYIIYKNIEFRKTYFGSKAYLLKVISWVKYENNNQRLAPMVLEKAYFSKNEWYYTHYGPYILEPDKYYRMLAEENILVFFVNADAAISAVFETANENMQSAGWDHALLIPEYFYREHI